MAARELLVQQDPIQMAARAQRDSLQTPARIESLRDSSAVGSILQAMRTLTGVIAFP